MLSFALIMVEPVHPDRSDYRQQYQNLKKAATEEPTKLPEQ